MEDAELKRHIYVPNYDHWKKICTQNYFSDRTLGSKTVENAVILPAKPRDSKNPYLCQGGVVDKDFKFVAGYNNMPPNQKNGAYCLDEAYTVEPDEITDSDDNVIFGGILVCHFGHFLTDCLARMWYVVEHQDDQRKVVFIPLKTSSLQELRAWVYHFLDLLGLPEDRIVILDKPTRFKSVEIPDQSVRIKHDFTKEFLAPFNHITNRIRPDNVKKLFLTRSSNVVSAMHLSNQEYFEKFYKKLGFTIVAPETLSVTNQIALVSGAEEVVTFTGSLAHWSLFSKPDTKWTFLNRVDEITTRQCLINQAKNINWYFVSVAMNFLYAEQGGGACLLGSTDHWKQYALHHHKLRLDPYARLPQTAVDDYIEHWCKFFSGKNNVDKRINTLENLYSRISIMEAKVKFNRPVLCFDVHSAQRGWLPKNVEGDISGFLEKEWSLQALKINFDEPFADVKYAIYYPDTGWTDECSNGETAGITGKDKAFYGVSIRLDNFRDGRQYDVLYRVHSFKGNWSMWQRNGERIVAHDYKLNGLQIKVEPRRRNL